MAVKRALKHRREGGPSVHGLVDSLIGKLMKMVTHGEIKPSVGHLIRLIELRNELKPTKVTYRWVDDTKDDRAARRRAAPDRQRV
jgi:hypothetical protein